MTPRNIHIASAGYLRRFAVGGHVMVHDVETGVRARRGVKAAARRLDWWGREPGLAEAIEKSLSQCEGPALAYLRTLDRRWPVERDAKAVIAQFIAIHVVRTPAFGVLLRDTAEAAIADERARGRIKPEDFEEAAKVFRGERIHAHSLLGQITRIASVLMSMQWIRVQFADGLLITGDQPVVALPWMPEGRQPNMAVMPVGGFLDTMEIRFSVDPQSALIMTWHPDEDAAEGVEGTFSQACNLNNSISRQADKEWFFRPDTVPHQLDPATLQRVVLPISPDLIRGYTPQLARSSPRRRAADQLMQEIVRDNMPRDQIRFVSASREPTAPEA